MRHCGLVATLLVLAAPANSALSAKIEIPPLRGPDKVSVQKGPPNCSRWSDGCVNCSRDDKHDQPVCSNPGIACQPKAIACVSPAATPKP